MGRALIIGAGAVSGFGSGLDTLYHGIFTGIRSVRRLERLADVDCLTEVAAEVPRSIAEACTADDLPLHLASLAAREALGTHTPDPRTALVLASTKADMSGVGRSGSGLGQPGRLARALATKLEWQGPVHAISAACASGLSALAFAGRTLARGAVSDRALDPGVELERVLVVGVDTLSEFILRGFSSLLALDPGPCRPFDRARRGLSLGDGAGAILLGRTGDGDTELCGWGESNDANHITGPCRDGAGLARAIDKALSHADIGADAVDFVHLHGTGTPFNDRMEQRALATVFDTVPTCAGSKAQLGHTLGAAGVLESVVTIEVLRRATAPGNQGYEHADDDAPFELSAHPITLPRSHTALKIAAGFGGINAVLAFQRTR